MTKTITATHTGTVTTITPKTIVVFLPALDLEVDVSVRTNDSTQNIRIPIVGDLATVQVALRDGDIIAIAATFVPQQDIREDIPVTDDDLLLLDNEDEDTEEYDRYNEPLVEDFRLSAAQVNVIMWMMQMPTRQHETNRFNTSDTINIGGILEDVKFMLIKIANRVP